MSYPLVSIVMSVYNDCSRVGKTIESILNQTYRNFEFIIVNDGSTDNTQDILNSYANQDSRIQIINQNNRGLTQALVQACKQVNGHFIFRQDSGDFSLPQRLERQVQVLTSNPEVALVSSYTKFITVEGDELKENSPGVLYSLQDKSPEGFVHFQMPTHHGNTAFSRDFYLKSGGYRSQFYFAQDCDLWSRLNELGSHQIIPEILYIAEFNTNSISGKNALEQQALRKLIEQATFARRSGASEHHFLEKASHVKPSRTESVRENQERLARAYYFIGSCLLVKKNPCAFRYFRQGIIYNPLHLRCWIKALSSLFFNLRQKQH